LRNVHWGRGFRSPRSRGQKEGHSTRWGQRGPPQFVERRSSGGTRIMFVKVTFRRSGPVQGSRVAGKKKTSNEPPVEKRDSFSRRRGGCCWTKGRRVRAVEASGSWGKGSPAKHRGGERRSTCLPEGRTCPALRSGAVGRRRALSGVKITW